jgi:hypothetical protein
MKDFDNNIEITPIGFMFNDVKLLNTFTIEQLKCISNIRKNLFQKIPSLREKINKNSKYFGFKVDKNKDSIYIYLQNKKMIMDIDISKEYKNWFIKRGFTIKERDNYQQKAGWITGIIFNYDCNKSDEIEEVMMAVLSNDLSSL